LAAQLMAEGSAGELQQLASGDAFEGDLGAPVIDGLDCSPRQFGPFLFGYRAFGTVGTHHAQQRAGAILLALGVAGER
jgi:hypothetical protein